MNNPNFFKTYQGRKVLLIISYGSTNYGTRTPESDNDYKVFLMPTLNDLYSGKMFSSNFKKNGCDYEVHDIRKVPMLISKANPTYLEILNAKETYVDDSFKSTYKWMTNNKHKLSRANLMGYYKAITGMAKQKQKAIEKDLPNESSNEGYKRKIKWGFDTKQLLHIVRLMMIREEVFMYGRSPIECIDLTQDFGKHSNLRGLKDRLLDIKANKDNYTKEQALGLSREYITDLRTTSDIEFDKFEVDRDILDELYKRIKDYVIRLVGKGE